MGLKKQVESKSLDELNFRQRETIKCSEKIRGSWRLVDHAGGRCHGVSKLCKNERDQACFRFHCGIVKLVGISKRPKDRGRLLDPIIPIPATYKMKHQKRALEYSSRLKTNRIIKAANG